jgi:hypothetical protein
MAENKINIEELAAKVASLESRVVALEDAPAPETKRALKTHSDLMRAELKELETDPEPHIEKRVNFGVSRDDAVKTIEQRKTFIRSELGIKPVAKKAAKVAAAIALIIGLFCPFSQPMRAADNQGYPSTYGAPTNWTSVITNGTAEPIVYIPFRKDAGLGLSQTFWEPYTNATGTIVSYGYPSPDGTNFNWLQPWTLLTSTLGGSNVVVTAVTNFNANQLRGFAGMYVVVTNTSITNPIIMGQITNTYVVNLVTNVNTNVSAGLFWNRPN